MADAPVFYFSCFSFDYISSSFPSKTLDKFSSWCSVYKSKSEVGWQRRNNVLWRHTYAWEKLFLLFSSATVEFAQPEAEADVISKEE